MLSDVEQAKIFLRGIVSLVDTEASYKWWDTIKHKYPDYQWDGEGIVSKRDAVRKSGRTNGIQSGD